MAINTCLLYVELATALGPQLDPHCDVLIFNLLKMSGFTKKITCQQSQASITAIISHTSPQPRLIIPLLWSTLHEKNVQSRAFAVGHFKHYLETHGQRSKHAIEVSGNLDTIEKAVKKSLIDPNPGVRELARTLFWVFAHVWKERGAAISNTLDPNARKQLDKACPSPSMHVPLPCTPDNSKKSSVATAIAASRAKAKAGATVSPVLRHREPSIAKGSGNESSPNASPKGVTTSRSRSPLGRSISSTLARLPLSASPGIVPSSATLHTRTPSGSSDTNSRAISPPSSNCARQKESSSIAATNISTTRTILVDSKESSDEASQVVPSLPGNQNDGPVGLGTAPVQRLSTDNESLLMAQSVPVPDDSDSEDDAVNVLSFSAAMQQLSPQKHSPRSLSLTFSATSRPSDALSTVSALDNITQQPVVEDALRARAEQAESAAERLLELVEPEDDLADHPILPLSLLNTTNGHKTNSTKPKPTLIHKISPQTPDNRADTILKKAALFANSPMVNHSKQTSLLDVLRSSKRETDWWLKRKACMSRLDQSSALYPDFRSKCLIKHRSSRLLRLWKE